MLQQSDDFSKMSANYRQNKITRSWIKHLITYIMSNLPNSIFNMEQQWN